MDGVVVECLAANDLVWVKSILEAQWQSIDVVSRGRLFDASQLPGFKAILNAKPVGLITYHLEHGACEVITLDSLVPGRGVGTQLLEAVVAMAKAKICSRVWLITTNDNLHALRFYQRRGFALAGLYPNALAEARRLKPSIPETGLEGIPLRDEIELELRLM